jgi:hypothetical protein
MPGVVECSARQDVQGQSAVGGPGVLAHVGVAPVSAAALLPLCTCEIQKR